MQVMPVTKKPLTLFRHRCRGALMVGVRGGQQCVWHVRLPGASSRKAPGPQYPGNKYPA